MIWTTYSAAMDKDIQSVSIGDMMPVIIERLESGQSVRFSPRGTSMLPMLRQGKDSVVLSPIYSRLKKYDLPLYIRDNGKVILHRIIKADETYTCLGDNQFIPEIGIRQDQLIGVVTEFYKGDKRHLVTERGYKLYCRLWLSSLGIRHFIHRGIGWLKRRI